MFLFTHSQTYFHSPIIILYAYQYLSPQTVRIK